MVFRLNCISLDEVHKLPSEVLKSVNNNEVKISGLKILSKIGEGGMSVVYLAEQISLRREVAVKVIRLEIANNDLDVQRFKNEAKTIAQLDHPNIINIYNIGQTAKGEVFFTMPYLNHGDFSNYLLEDEQEFIVLLQSICDGLSFAHDRGVVHRDIKPENLLFDKFGNVCIADFGIAITKDGNRMTKEHQVVGSAQYMSPEQARSLTVDVHSDIYSLGIVIYERLTGHVPFDGEDSISVLVNHVSTPPPALPAKMRHWQNVIDKCLAKSPKDRFQSMVELKIELSKVPVNSLQRTNRSIKSLFFRSNGQIQKWFFPSIAVLLCMVFIGLGYSIYNKNKSTDFNDAQIIEQAVIKQSTQSNTVENNRLKTGEDLSKETLADQTTESKDTTSESIAEQTQTNKGLGHTIDSIDEIKQELSFEQLPQVTLMSMQEPMSQSVDQTELLLGKALKNIASYQLLKPANNNATDQLLQVLALKPGSAEAIKGLQAVGQKYYYLIDSSLKKGDFTTALIHVRSLLEFQEKSMNINDKFSIQKKSIIQSLAQLDVSQDDFTIERINILLEIVTVLAPEDDLLEDYQKQILIKSGPQIGDVLVDNEGINTVVVSEGLAVSTTEVTLASYQRFASSTNRKAAKCRHKGGGVNSFFNNKTWNNPYFKQQQNHPVSCVTMEDAVAFIDWLNQQTQLSYRLLTQDEFLALSSAEKTSFKACQSANIAGAEANKIRNKEDKFECNDQYKFTAPVSIFVANELGLFDIYGNVSEWVACQQSPCTAPVAMGSSWLHGKQSNASIKKETLKQGSAFSYIGFRLARSL